MPDRYIITSTDDPTLIARMILDISTEIARLRPVVLSAKKSRPGHVVRRDDDDRGVEVYYSILDDGAFVKIARPMLERMYGAKRVRAGKKGKLPMLFVLAPGQK